jgi:hypothetical protein
MDIPNWFIALLVVFIAVGVAVLLLRGYRG